MLCDLPIDGDVMGKYILSKVGRQYYNRDLVLCDLPLGLFGCDGRKRIKRVYLTLHNGILNHCGIRLARKPSVYWVVLDSAIHLKSGFTRCDVVDMSVEFLGEEHRRACLFAWDVLRNHHRHARKYNVGMSHMVDIGDDGKLLVRARDASETMQYFLSQGERKCEAMSILSQGL